MNRLGESTREVLSLDRDQRNAFIASFLGWSLDAFDFFLLVFVLADVSKEFHTSVTKTAFATALTLALRPVGAVLFGFAADRYGRRIPLMVNIAFFSFIELLTAFSPNITVFFILRALFGIGMGGEWGVGASLAMESVPVKARGMLSGILQEGYPVGYLLAALVYGAVAPHFGHSLFGVFHVSWRTLFVIGVLPGLLTLFIRRNVKEPAAWREVVKSKPKISRIALANVPLFLGLVLLMAAFNFMSHGTQDLYPTFLKLQHHFSSATVTEISVVANIGAICGGVLLGSLSQVFGRRRTIIAGALLALPVIPLWAFSHTAAMLALGAFLIQFCVQGAWGVIPAHLNELSPNELRGLFPGLAYQLGNLCAAMNLPLQSHVADLHGGNYGFAMSIVVAIAIVAAITITAFGREKHGVAFVASPESS
jgi:MFS transporter, SHS family, lactate transporter